MIKHPPHKIWNERFHPKSKRRVILADDLWMDQWKQNLIDITNKQALDLGCGCGLDSLYLSGLGFKVTAIDFSEEALNICKENAPDVNLMRHDISETLPFSKNQFGVISANLSLHYFDKQMTHRIIADIHRCLDKNGVLMVCLNSTKDIHYGAFGETEIEPNFFVSGGMSKRFFDRPSIDYFFNSLWSIIHVEEMTTHKYGPPKKRWEVILKKEDGDINWK